MPSTALSTELSLRTHSSYIILPPGEPAIWPHLLDPHPMFIYRPPPPPEPMAPGDLRASLLHAAEYLDASLDAQIEGDEEAMRSALEVTRGIVQVALGKLRWLVLRKLPVH